jgi:dipeptidyl-peptidase-4
VSGKLINPITTGATFEAGNILKVDETAGLMFYMARDGENYMKQQLHRVGLDGKGDVRLTDPKFTHTVSVSPDNKFFTDVYQTHDTPAATQLVDAAGKVVAQLAKSDLTKFNALGMKKVEMFTVQGLGRHDDAVRDHRVSIDVRSSEEVSNARQCLRRPRERQ